MSTIAWFDVAAVPDNSRPVHKVRLVRWFTVCEYVVRSKNPDIAPRPSSRAHAKEMGTYTTACGLLVNSWHRLWELPFENATSDSCDDCADVVRSLLVDSRVDLDPRE